MKKYTYIIILVILMSCSKDDNSIYNPLIGDWSIYPETLYDLSGFPNENNDKISFDTTYLTFGDDNILKPDQQDHVIYLNSEYINSNSQNLIAITVDNLPDEASKMIQKSCLVDFSMISSITLSLHCEILTANKPVIDNDISVVIRLSSNSDILENYFEIEQSLMISQDSDSIASEIWPEDNFINTNISELESLLANRDEILEDNQITENSIYMESIGTTYRKVKGNPDIKNISSICIGIKNPGNMTQIGTNDGLNKSVKVWVY